MCERNALRFHDKGTIKHRCPVGLGGLYSEAPCLSVIHTDSSVPIRPAHPADSSTTSTDNESLEKSVHVWDCFKMLSGFGSKESTYQMFDMSNHACRSENAEVLRGLAGAPGSDEGSLPDSNALDTTTKTTTGLPSAADMFDQVREAPAYLRPEITGLSKDINNDADNALNTVAQSNVALPIKSKGQKQRQGWDVSMMAPKLHSPEPSHTTISSKPISFDHNHSPSRQGTQAMTVEEFLEKGVGGAQLPRKRYV